MDDLLESRLAELVERAEQRGIDWRDRTKEFTADRRPVIAALATLLGIDAFAVLDARRSLDELEEYGRAAAAAEAELYRQAANDLAGSSEV